MIFAFSPSDFLKSCCLFFEKLFLTLLRSILLNLFHSFLLKNVYLCTHFVLQVALKIDGNPKNNYKKLDFFSGGPDFFLGRLSFQPPGLQSCPLNR